MSPTRRHLRLIWNTWGSEPPRGKRREKRGREVAHKCRVYTVADAIETKETQLADLGSQAESLYTTGSLTIGTRRRVVV